MSLWWLAPLGFLLVFFWNVFIYTELHSRTSEVEVTEAPLVIFTTSKILMLHEYLCMGNTCFYIAEKLGK